ncbi:MAG: preprotein translocase subunit SecG [Ignavibacteriae bacterium]|nr:preprotein translocase subunit SecG [Ignavibacteriota bacterium]
MFTILAILEIIVSLLLIIVVLMQASKGSGLAGAFGGSQMGAMFGARRAADFLSKATTVLAVVFLALCLVINIFVLDSSAGAVESIIQQGQPTSVPAPVPPQATPPAQQGK